METSGIYTTTDDSPSGAPASWWHRCTRWIATHWRRCYGWPASADPESTCYWDDATGWHCYRNGTSAQHDAERASMAGRRPTDPGISGWGWRDIESSYNRRAERGGRWDSWSYCTQCDADGNLRPYDNLHDGTRQHVHGQC